MIDTHPTRGLSSTQQRYLANGILKALRRGPTRATQGSDQRFHIIGANTIPNGPPPIVNATWWLARMEPHEGLGLPEVGILISDTTLAEAETACTQREWSDLMHVTHNTSIEALYRVRHHERTGWFAQRHPEAGAAPGAAVTILELAHLAGHLFRRL